MTISADQRLVNEAYAHLKSTGVKSARVKEPFGEFCEYGSSGCAFAPAILPEKRGYADELESTASEIIKNFPEYLEDWAKDCDPKIAREVQLCHDEISTIVGNNFFDGFCANLRNVCADYNLDFPGDTHGCI